jgi:plasmid stability protein
MAQPLGEPLAQLPSALIVRLLRVSFSEQFLRSCERELRHSDVHATLPQALSRFLQRRGERDGHSWEFGWHGGKCSTECCTRDECRHHIRYHTWMTKTTVYLPDDLKLALARIASSSGRSEADLIREALRDLVQRSGAPRPAGALFASGDSSLSGQLEEALGGFGER